MKRLIIIAATLFLTTLANAQVQTVDSMGAVVNGPSLVIQKPVHGEFRNGELVPFVRGTQARLVLRENTARGSVVTVTTRHAWDNSRVLYRVESRKGLEIVGDDDSGYTVQDSEQVWLRLVPCGDFYIIDAE